MKSIQAILKKCNNAYDEYGTRSTAEYEPVRRIDIKISLYQQNNTDDARYADATHFALTRDKDITDEMRVEVEGKEYDVILANSYSRQTQLFLKEA